MNAHIIAIQTVEHCIDILAEHPENNKTQTARKILRTELMDFRNQTRQWPKPSHVFLCVILSLGLALPILVWGNAPIETINGSKLPKVEIVYREVK